MLKKLRVLLVAAAAIVPLVVVTAPTAAHAGVCVGQWGLHIGDNFGALGSSQGTTSFFLNDISVCAANDSLFARGEISGACGAASGQAVTSSGHAFHFTWFGTMVYVEGTVTGVLELTLLDPRCVEGRSSVSHAVGTLLAPN